MTTNQVAASDAPSSFAASLRAKLEHPLTRGMSIDDPRTTALRTQIIQQKVFLRRLYEEWYRAIASAVPTATDEPALEIGTGAGFLRETGLIPGLITSDVLPLPGVDQVIDAREMPFADGSLRAVVMTDALHHFPDVRSFMKEAARSVRSGGVLSLVEPWVTPWSRVIYSHLHHEPFRPDAATWEFPDSGPLSGANGALPWILFQRDRAQFEREFPAWRVEQVRLMMPFRYLVSGGVSMRTLSPDWSFGLWGSLETALRPLMPLLAMFAHVTVRRV